MKEIRFTFNKIPYNTSCVLIREYSNSGFRDRRYISGTKIFECFPGDTVQFKHKHYVTLNMKTVKKDNGKVFDMNEEFEYIAPEDRGFIKRLLRMFRGKKKKNEKL